MEKHTFLRESLSLPGSLSVVCSAIGYTVNGSRQWGSRCARPTTDCTKGIIRPLGTFFKEEGKLRKQSNAARLPTTDHRLLIGIIRPLGTFFKEEGKLRKQ